MAITQQEINIMNPFEISLRKPEYTQNSILTTCLPEFQQQLQQNSQQPKLPLNSCLNDSIKFESPTSDDTPLGKYDVICGRGRVAFNHAGNKRFREVVKSNLRPYSNATTKGEKSMIVSHIMQIVRLRGNFVKCAQGSSRLFRSVPERLAREKVGQVLRDILHTQYKSSTEAKKQRRWAQKEHRDAQIQKIVTENRRIASIITIANNEVQEGNLVTDEEFAKVFMSANLNILKELKESKCVDMLQDSTTTTTTKESLPSEPSSSSDSSYSSSNE